MNGADNKNDLKVFNLDFGDLYTPQHIQLALADLISKDDPNKPIIAAHLEGCNSMSNVSALQEGLISEEDHQRMNQELKKTPVDQSVKDKLVTLSKEAIAKEFDAMFALLEKHNRPIAYIRWMPKDDELFATGRGNAKGHYVCLYFFCDHNNTQSILIANPNGMGITEESEANVINSYLKKNPTVNIYQSKDYTQFGNTTCGPGALTLLRILYNISKQKLIDVLKKGEKKTLGEDNKFDFTSIEFGQDALKKEIGTVPQKNTPEEKVVDQKLRRADCEAATIYTKNNSNIIGDTIAIKLSEIPFNKERVEDLTKDQATLLSKLLLSGKQFLTPEQIQQVQRKREEIFDIEEEKETNLHNQPSGSGSAGNGSRYAIQQQQILNQCNQTAQQEDSTSSIKPQKKVHFDPSTKHESNKSELHNSAQGYKPAGKCGLSMGFITASIFVAILSAFFLSISDTDLGKKLCGAGLAASILVFVSTIAYLCLRKTPDSKMTIATKTPLIETIEANQQPPKK